MAEDREALNAAMFSDLQWQVEEYAELRVKTALIEHDLKVAHARLKDTMYKIGKELGVKTP